MIHGFKIGHYSDYEGGTGTTVIIAENGAVGGVDVRGSAPAPRETDLLKGCKAVEKINAVCLSGGSASVSKRATESCFGWRSMKKAISPARDTCLLCAAR